MNVSVLKPKKKKKIEFTNVGDEETIEDNDDDDDTSEARAKRFAEGRELLQGLLRAPPQWAPGAPRPFPCAFSGCPHAFESVEDCRAHLIGEYQPNGEQANDHGKGKQSSAANDDSDNDNTDNDEDDDENEDDDDDDDDDDTASKRKQKWTRSEVCVMIRFKKARK